MYPLAATFSPTKTLMVDSSNKDKNELIEKKTNTPLKHAMVFLIELTCYHQYANVIVKEVNNSLIHMLLINS